MFLPNKVGIFNYAIDALQLLGNLRRHRYVISYIVKAQMGTIILMLPPFACMLLLCVDLKSSDRLMATVILMRRWTIFTCDEA